MDSRSGRLRGENAGLGIEQVLPAGIHDGCRSYFSGELQEDFVVAQFRREQGAVEAGQLLIAGGSSKNAEAFAGAKLDEGRNQQSVHDLCSLSFADEEAECIGVVVLVAAVEVSAALLQDADHLSEVRGLIA